MKRFIILIGFISYLHPGQFISAQAGIGMTTPDLSSLLDLSSGSKGMLVPDLPRPGKKEFLSRHRIAYLPADGNMTGQT